MILTYSNVVTVTTCNILYYVEVVSSDYGGSDEGPWLSVEVKDVETGKAVGVSSNGMVVRAEDLRVVSGAMLQDDDKGLFFGPIVQSHPLTCIGVDGLYLMGVIGGRETWQHIVQAGSSEWHSLDLGKVAAMLLKACREGSINLKPHCSVTFGCYERHSNEGENGAEAPSCQLL